CSRNANTRDGREGQDRRDGRTAEASSLSSQSCPSSPFDYLEHIAVHRLAKKEALERRGPERLNEGRALFDQPRFEFRELLQRVQHRDVPSELALERRHFEPLDVEHVHLLAAADI